MALSFREALNRLEDRRVKVTRPLIPPQILQEDLPLCDRPRKVRYILAHRPLVQDPQCCPDRSGSPQSGRKYRQGQRRPAYGRSRVNHL